MAHYAFIDSDNVVVEVITGRDEHEVVDGISDWEAYYSTKRDGLTAVRTSYNTKAGEHLEGGEPFRCNYAGVGFSYDPQRDAFIPPKPFESWILNQDTCLWEPPIAMPEDGKAYSWNEDTVSWEPVSEV